MDIPQLDAAVQFYCRKGIAEATQKTYLSAMKRFASFCALYDIETPFPVSQVLLCYYVSSLAGQGLAPRSIATYLAAVRHGQVLAGFPEPKEYSAMPQLRLVLAGVKRTYAEKQGKVRSGRGTRLPITPPILRRLRSRVLQIGPGLESGHDDLMLWAAIVTAFFSFFRSGEITVPSAAGFNPDRHLKWGDVCANRQESPSLVRVHLSFSKCDQLGRGVDVFLGATGDELCPVVAVTSYARRCGSAPGPFFRFADGRPLVKTAFVEGVRRKLTEIGLDSSRYAGHSFRIGAATTAASVGLEDSVIRALGRWNSSAFLVYVRTPRAQLAEFSRSLASGTKL